MRAAPAARPGDAPSADSAAPALVDIMPAALETRLAFARHLLSTFARRALADLGLLPVEDPDPAEGIPTGIRALHVRRSHSDARCDATAAGTKGQTRC